VELKLNVSFAESTILPQLVGKLIGTTCELEPPAVIISARWVDVRHLLQRGEGDAQIFPCR